ncbi:MAG: RNA polymerase sigma factor [Planctomycetes bacterium]|jgi:RNA polymerase sigma-70 factor (ECF subfamily)|nr:RNA polymerase sigma factor [Planctomycetota bacterium]
MHEQLSDETLIRGTARGRTDMFETLVRRHADALYGFLVRRTGDAHLAEDLLQETLLRAHSHAGQFRGEGSGRGWLHAVAAHLAFSALASGRRGPPRRAKAGADGAEGVANGRPGPEARAEEGETAEAVRKAVGELPDRQQEVFLLRVYQELPFEEIARALGITAGAARAHMHKALAELRKRLRFLES